jgi:hypothetical protein
MKAQWFGITVVAAAAVVAFVLLTREPASPGTVPFAAEITTAEPGSAAPTAGTAAPSRDSAVGEAPRYADGSRDGASAAAAPRPRAAGAISWPKVGTASSRSAAPTRAKTAGEPAIAVELAFQALRLVGIDAEAERTWRRAIDDPRMPAGSRSDLIEDLNQEGFTDNSRPTKADLPLILARLELIERLLPPTKDETNRASFEEAYKDLLAMYVRLGGVPRR